MNFTKSYAPIIILIIIGIGVLVFSIIDILLNTKLIVVTLFSYTVLIVLLVIFFIRRRKQKEFITVDAVEEFEKTLKGGLHHFKCPTCSGIFAVKKSMGDNNIYVKMTCPDCGAIGYLSPNPAEIEEEIPEKKSLKANFKCVLCGEGLTVWAEGTDLHEKVGVYACPFCGEYDTMNRI